MEPKGASRAPRAGRSQACTRPRSLASRSLTSPAAGRPPGHGRGGRGGGRPALSGAAARAAGPCACWPGGGAQPPWPCAARAPARSCAWPGQCPAGAPRSLRGGGDAGVGTAAERQDVGACGRATIGESGWMPHSRLMRSALSRSRSVMPCVMLGAVRPPLGGSIRAGLTAVDRQGRLPAVPGRRRRAGVRSRCTRRMATATWWAGTGHPRPNRREEAGPG